ncbi:MAG: metal-dependent transcriptional regulator [Candidatus Eremiobacteraeota bacterium]|nr:metal-dependent transcriptional regulator [Candidatus Eremiobacteraeota bacterium]MBV8365418.1 metal-dependent transcriptional regulator [Candidatus Eremiobacteraeota bacterium]
MPNQRLLNSALKTPLAEPLDEPEVSPNVEMYLKTIVRLQRGREPVSTSAIASELAVSAASASAMLKKLDADGYVSHDGRHGVIPTAAGAKIGALTLRRQRLAERLLVDHLGIPWEFAYAEACRLEHAISPLVERHLYRFTGEPATCPHGHAIPRDDGTLWDHEDALDLIDLPVGSSAKVLEVKHDMPELLRYLAQIGLRPGTIVSVEKFERAVGLLTLRVNGKAHSVSTQLAGAITVKHSGRPLKSK